MDDPYDLARFVEAQAPVMSQVMAELTAGRKRSHWMWFVFPQLDGLGSSPMARRYGLRSLVEADAYLAHDILSGRLTACTELVNQVEALSITDILGSPDDMKFRSCMTLFSRATPAADVFAKALDKYFRGQPDHRTLELLQA